MSVGLLFYMFGSTKISEFSDIRKCLNTFMYQALAFLASKNAAEIRLRYNFVKNESYGKLPRIYQFISVE